MLSVKSVSKHYSGKTALDQVSLQADPGKILGLLGPNGAGKTSLIRIITMITAPDSGEVFFENQKMRQELISGIGYLPEERGLYRKMTILDQAMYFGRLKGLSRTDCMAAIRHWFDKLEMSDWKKKKLEELSKGMQQKVQFVLTVLHKPRLIILDEPFTGFDPLNAEIIKEEILGLRDQGACILLSTHRMESVEELCDDITLINNGKVIIEGEVNEVRNRFKKSEFELVYTGTLKSGLPGVLERKDTALRDGATHSLFVMQKDAAINELIQEVMKQAHLLEFREKIPSIKDIFIERIGAQL
ncbi:MAG TPA: ABC transporter ATP-binding protein [Bacteroidetes bacterium]|nr:ABC transporter ATP-binding protein [Bacteroidota bacterium]